MGAVIAQHEIVVLGETVLVLFFSIYENFPVFLFDVMPFIFVDDRPVELQVFSVQRYGYPFLGNIERAEAELFPACDGAVAAKLNTPAIAGRGPGVVTVPLGIIGGFPGLREQDQGIGPAGLLKLLFLGD